MHTWRIPYNIYLIVYIIGQAASAKIKLQNALEKLKSQESLLSELQSHLASEVQKKFCAIILSSVFHDRLFLL